ncbi:MAG TPA: DUF2306 domain-containing protein [Rhizomicrobium sp.]|jgi:uncharacterized membrane protein
MHVADIIAIGWIHVIACLVALAAGAWNLALPKGTALHRKVGTVYVLAMIVLNVSVFAVYKFDIGHFVPFAAGPNTFGFFHWLAVAALVFVCSGWYAARHQDRAVWAYLHPVMMLLSYYDLIGGGINEVFARLDPLRALARASAKTTGQAVNAPIIGLVQTAAMAGTLLLIVYFAARVALWRRKAKLQSIPA